MNLKGIIAISGKTGLYKLVSQTRGGAIVQSIVDNKIFPVSSTASLSSLSEIAMYTASEELPLKEIMRRIAEKEDLGLAPSHKAPSAEVVAYYASIVPDYDTERVYESHMRKLFQWYNILSGASLVSKEAEQTQDDEQAPSAIKEKKTDKAVKPIAEKKTKAPKAQNVEKPAMIKKAGRSK